MATKIEEVKDTPIEVICYSTTPLGMASIQPCCLICYKKRMRIFFKSLSLQKRVVKEAEARVKELEKQILSHLGTESIWMLLLACPKAFGRLLPSFGYLDSLAREKAMVVNLGFIKAIVIAEEVLLLDPLQHEVLPFVDQLRQQLLTKARSKGILWSLKSNLTGLFAHVQKTCERLMVQGLPVYKMNKRREAYCKGLFFYCVVP
ncbi:hypothetical protein Vadar_009831 [Vaccinium darrowii]|uniref:Uncharacterized protein n=1 Tax=Vaccinium darrowii TaxID=229202 RepID=A0ACB7XYL5_9ERIC|nr:hypothetical protein Vadar_009831 [Vaccinium darrowii]